MATKVNPSPEKIGEIVAAYMERTSLNPMQLVPENEVIRHIGRKHRATNWQADRWLHDAIEAGTVVLIYAKNEGRMFSQLKKNTLGSDHRFMADVIEGLEYSWFQEVHMDSEGLVHLEKKLPEGKNPPPDKSRWITTPTKLRSFVAEVNAQTAAARAGFAASRIIENSSVEILSGDALDHIYGLLYMAGILTPKFEGRGSFYPRIGVKNDVRVTIDLDRSEIEKVSEFLKSAGIPAHKKWREFL